MSEITPKKIINGIKQMLINANAIMLDNVIEIETTLDTKVLEDIIEYGKQQANKVYTISDRDE